MRLIVTHDMADFDAFAAAVAAQKLHAGATIALGRRLGPDVREYLALHKDRFPALRMSDVDAESVSELVIVDVRRRERLKDYQGILVRQGAGVRVVVYDHHPASDDDVIGDDEFVEAVGSSTTLLVEHMLARGLAIDAVEATLFSLGVHADTGSLTYASTTPRDARVLAELLARGANLGVIARYLRPAFSAQQRAVLAQLMDRVQTDWIGNLAMGFVLLELPEAIDGFADVVSELAALTGHAAMFAVFGLGGRRVQVVARAKAASVDVGAALAALGGGGHASAAAASLSRPDAAAVMEELRAFARAHPPQPTRVADLMSSPVITAAHDTPLREILALLKRHDITGVPITRDGRMVGIISRRDITRAERDERDDLSAASCMAHELSTTTPNASLAEALQQMEADDVGRLPVLRAGHLIGIVTRKDVRRALYRDG